MKDDFLQGIRIRVILINKVQNAGTVDIIPAMRAGGCLGEGGIGMPAANTLKAFESHDYSGRILSPLTGEAVKKLKSFPSPYSLPEGRG
jgi:hypothetical protein